MSKIKLDKDSFENLKGMYFSPDPRDKIMFQKIIVNNLDNNDPETAYWTAKLVYEMHKHYPKLAEIFKQNELKLHTKWLFPELSLC